MTTTTPSELNEEDLVHFNLGASDPWDDENDDYPEVIFHKVPSADIVYETTPQIPKFVGKYLLGDALGEGSYARVRYGGIIVVLLIVTLATEHSATTPSDRIIVWNGDCVLLQRPTDLSGLFWSQIQSVCHVTLRYVTLPAY